jgi:hypothetical protein
MIVELGQGKYYLYRHIRLDTGKPFYIGIGTIQESYRPYRRSTSKLSRNQYWKNIVNITDYEVEILLESNCLNYIKSKEEEFIALYKLKVDGGMLCNLTYGGELNLHTEETKLKMKQVKQNISQETREKMRKSAKTKFVSEETKERLRKTSIVNRMTKEMYERAAASNRGKKRTEQQKIDMSNRRKGKMTIKKIFPIEQLLYIKNNYIPKTNNQRKRKAIDVFLLDGTFIMFFSSITECSKHLSIKTTYIRRVLSKKIQQSHSLIFKYAEEI